jgi:hypothetical protein
MRRHRTTARGGISLLLLLGLSAGVAVASPGNYPGLDGPGPHPRKPSAATPSTKPTAKPSPKTRLLFPLVGPAQYHNDFGEARPIGHEEGNDILTPRHTPVVAPENATVKFWTDSGAGCMLYLYGKSGTTYLYLHLNDDVSKNPNTNDNRGKCKAGGSYAPSLKDGQKVAAGQLIAFSGDSGNADGIPHLEFQMRPHDGKPISPYKTLNRALRLMFVKLPGKTFTLSASATVVSTTIAADASSATLKVEVKSVRAWPGGYRIANVNRNVTFSVAGTDTIQLIRPGPTPAAATVSLQRLLAAKKGTALTVTTAPAAAKLDAQLGRGLFDAATVVLKPS